MNFIKLLGYQINKIEIDGNDNYEAIPILFQNVTDKNITSCWTKSTWNNSKKKRLKWLNYFMIQYEIEMKKK